MAPNLPSIGEHGHPGRTGIAVFCQVVTVLHILQGQGAQRLWLLRAYVVLERIQT